LLDSLLQEVNKLFVKCQPALGAVLPEYIMPGT